MPSPVNRIAIQTPTEVGAVLIVKVALYVTSIASKNRKIVDPNPVAFNAYGVTPSYYV